MAGWMPWSSVLGYLSLWSLGSRYQNDNQYHDHGPQQCAVALQEHKYGAEWARQPVNGSAENVLPPAQTDNSDQPATYINNDVKPASFIPPGCGPQNCWKKPRNPANETG